ncbi:MAG: hypothetical protein GXO24_01230 [Chlorobi bacterium]|nr:hypothetical protein [Chlorobiota bacterium]
MNRISMKNLFLTVFLIAGLWLRAQPTDMVPDDITHGDFLVLATDSIDVYAKPDAFSPMVYRIPAHRLFYAVPVENSPWYQVYVPTDSWDRKTSSGAYSYIKGYIFSNRFALLDRTKQTDSIPLKLIFITGRKPNRTLGAVNRYYGYFPDRAPSDYIRQMYMEFRGHRIRQPEYLYKDLLNLSYKEPRFTSDDKDKFTYYRIGNIYVIEQNGGDGCYSFYVYWVIRNGKIIQRLIWGM